MCRARLEAIADLFVSGLAFRFSRLSVCLIARSTQLLLQVVAATAPLLSAAASASAAALSNRSSRNPTPVHPALAALHALLLPPLLYPQAFAHLQVDTPKGLLLSGPPGVGKTYSVSRVCRDLDVELFLLDGASLFGGAGSVAGAAEEAMRDKFAEARACKKPAVLFIDEIVSERKAQPRTKRPPRCNIGFAL